MSEVLKALQGLDPQNDEHWTDQGLPRLAALGGKYSREQITQAAPDFNRATAHEQAVAEVEDSLEAQIAEADKVFKAAQEAYDEAKRELEKVQEKLDILIAQKPKPRPGSEIMAYLNAQVERKGEVSKSRLDRSMAGRPQGHGFNRPNFVGR